jgi:hypothetical protein
MTRPYEVDVLRTRNVELKGLLRVILQRYKESGEISEYLQRRARAAIGERRT